MTKVLPDLYKAIALFTPGGDLIYGVDPDKQAQWHSHLCLELQKRWELVDTPHFLVPGYTATVERWLDPQTQQVKTIAEVYPPVQRYIALLEVLFDLEPTTYWHIAPWQEEHCSRAVIETHKSHFPQLWLQQDLIIRLENQALPQKVSKSTSSQKIAGSNLNTSQIAQEQSVGYVFRLFMSSNNVTAEKTLNSIHQLLEQGLTSPYSLKVIDINKNPEQAAIHQITVTPTLVRVAPKPVRRIVGQFDDLPRMLGIISSF